MDTSKISSRQLMFTMIVFRLTMVISYMPIINFPPANQDIWIVILFSIVHVTVLRIPILFLTNKFKEFNLVEYMEKIFGKFLGKFIGALSC